MQCTLYLISQIDTYTFKTVAIMFHTSSVCGTLILTHVCDLKVTSPDTVQKSSLNYQILAVFEKNFFLIHI